MEKRNDQAVAAGEARCPGTSWNDIMRQDSREVPAFLTEEHYEYLGSEPVSSARYFDPDFAAAERERLWPCVWQFAAREEELPEAGDFVVFENAGRSFLLVRQETGEVRAFHNVCLHRGRKLRTESGWAEEFVCPFHGFAWKTDGSFSGMPCSWDFPHLEHAELHLPEVYVARWGGYIFVRESAEGPTIEEYLHPIPEHFTRWRHEECVTVAWVAKVVPANWKTTMEAFMESYHAYVTHPQLMPFHGDANASYSNWGDHVNASWSLFGVISPHLDPTGKSQQWIVDEFEKYNGRTADNFDKSAEQHVVVPEGITARKAVGDVARQTYSALYGRDFDDVSDAELMDAFVYNVFPNLSFWGGFMPNIIYHWKPETDPDHCVMEVRILSRLKPGEKVQRCAPRKFLGLDQKWTEAPELGVLGDVFEQDMSNLVHVQEGLKASVRGEINLANYQEIRVRHFERTLDRYIGGQLP